MAESDSDTTLGLKQILLYRRRTSSNETKQQINMSSLRQQKYHDDSPETKWIQTPNVAGRRYIHFLSLKQNRMKERKKSKCHRRSKC